MNKQMDTQNSFICHGYSEYPKSSKIWDTSNNCHNRPKNRKV